MKTSKKQNMFIAIELIAFLAYNVILFVLSGFDHTAVFWLSWVFMTIAFVTLFAVMTLLGQKGMLMRDWLFGFPIVKHTVAYIVSEFILSSVFMLLENDVEWKLPFVLQLLVLAVYLVFAISCFMAKQTIEGIKENVAAKTQNIKFLRTNADMLVTCCEDPELKKELTKFAEAVRYSDPMSADALAPMEAELARLVFECKTKLMEKDYVTAEAICREASLLLQDRNNKCKILKA